MSREHSHQNPSCQPRGRSFKSGGARPLPRPDPDGRFDCKSGARGGGEPPRYPHPCIGPMPPKHAGFTRDTSFLPSLSHNHQRHPRLRSVMKLDVTVETVSTT
jgi:hypothetical protein